MRVTLFVADIDQIGGAEIAVKRLVMRLHEYGIDAEVLSTVGLRRWISLFVRHAYAKITPARRLPVWQRDQRTFIKSLQLQVQWTLPLFFRQTKLLHVRGLTPATVMLAKMARRSGIRTLCTPMASGAHGDIASLPPDMNPAMIARFDHIAVMTKAMRAEVVNAGYPATRISIIPNGVDPGYFKPSDRPLNQPQVVFVGQFRPEKRVDLLLRAWKDVAAEYPQAQLTLVGGGSYLADYQHLAGELGITPTFVPNTDAAGVLAHLQASSIFVAPGISEGMSNALLEAMAVGLAPVVADTPASQEVITPGVDGLVYSAESPEALVAQIKRLCTDVPLRQRLGAAARRTVLRRFTLDRVTRQYAALYKQILDETREHAIPNAAP